MITQDRILGILRHTLTFAGGFLVTKGLADETMITDLTGATLTIVGVVWSMVAKKRRK